ncbi:helix-turn-helix domain-containing protein [Streptomyces roseus]|uniref:helix-turn-helix domain-containing protein n=1 Tax=Streptomyces roseus TaxID=66430 RepID=UPI0036CD0B74
MAERAGVELSAASVSALFTKQPSQVKLSTLAALCTALDCAPGDLLVRGPSALAPASGPVPAGLSDGRPPPRSVAGCRETVTASPMTLRGSSLVVLHLPGGFSSLSDSHVRIPR